MNRKLIFGSLAAVVYVNLLPYVARVFRGWDFVTQLLPDDDLFPVEKLLGVIFLPAFATLPALPVIGALALRKNIPITLVVVLVATTALIGLFHYYLDLSADAQSAVALVFGPVLITGVTVTVGTVFGLGEFLIRRR